MFSTTIVNDMFIKFVQKPPRLWILIGDRCQQSGGLMFNYFVNESGIIFLHTIELLYFF